MSEVVIYTTRICPYCLRAKHLLGKKGVDFREVTVDGRPDLRQEMMVASGRNTVPQIWMGETHIGGCDDLYSLEYRGELDALLAEARLVETSAATALDQAS